MVIIENVKLLVKLTDSEYQNYLNRAKNLAHSYRLPSGDLREHTPAEIARGLILSDAAEKIRNINELTNINMYEDSSYLEFLKHVKNVFSEFTRDNEYRTIDSNGLPVTKKITEEAQKIISALEGIQEIRYQYLKIRVRNSVLYVTIKPEQEAK